MKKAAIYTRVSTDDQNCERQIRDLQAFAERAGFEVVAVFTETASGAKNDRAERAKVIELARSRKIDAILVTELTRWGRSTVDLLSSLQDLNKMKVSVIAQTGNQFDLDSAQGKMIAGMLAVLAQFERDLVSERTKSGLAAAKARGKTLGRPQGNKTVSKHRNAVLKMRADGLSYARIADKLGIGKQTVQDIVTAE